MSTLKSDEQSARPAHRRMLLACRCPCKLASGCCCSCTEHTCPAGRAAKKEKQWEEEFLTAAAAASAAFVVLAEAEGVKCFRASDFDGAIFHFTEAIKYGPSDPAQVLGNRAAAFEKIGDFEAAMADSCAALEASPDYLKGYFRKATSLMALGRYAEASAAADDGLRKQPKNTQLLELKEKARAAVLGRRSQRRDGGAAHTGCGTRDCR